MEAPDNTRACWSGSGTTQPSTCPVGSRPTGATTNGVYDLAGNVYEWNADWYAAYASTGTGCWTRSATNNPICNNGAAGNRVVRGGSWDFVAVSYLRSASRYFYTPANRNDYLGFRCARDTP